MYSLDRILSTSFLGSAGSPWPVGTSELVLTVTAVLVAFSLDVSSSRVSPVVSSTSPASSSGLGIMPSPPPAWEGGSMKLVLPSLMGAGL